jgi:hypothetical protein
MPKYRVDSNAQPQTCGGRLALGRLSGVCSVCSRWSAMNEQWRASGLDVLELTIDD